MRALVLLLLASCGIDVTGASQPAEAGAPPSATQTQAPPPSPNAPPPAFVDGGTPDSSTPLTPTLSDSTAAFSGTVDLTAEGTLDWAHWGHTSATTPVRKATGGALVGNYVVTGTGAATASYNSSGWPIHTKWTDGDNPASATDDQTFLYLAYANNGVGTLEVPGGVKQRVLTLYLGGYASSGKIHAEMSDSSSAVVDVTPSSSNSGFWAFKIAFTYRGASPSAKLVVKWQVVSLAQNNSTIEIDSATLREIP